jgi:hypothetical protein
VGQTQHNPVIRTLDWTWIIAATSNQQPDPEGGWSESATQHTLIGQEGLWLHLLQRQRARTVFIPGALLDKLLTSPGVSAGQQQEADEDSACDSCRATIPIGPSFKLFRSDPRPWRLPWLTQPIQTAKKSHRIHHAGQHMQPQFTPLKAQSSMIFFDLHFLKLAWTSFDRPSKTA